MRSHIEPFLTVSGKPLKRLNSFAVANTSLKRGVNESLHLLGFNHDDGMNCVAVRIESANGNQPATVRHPD